MRLLVIVFALLVSTIAFAQAELECPTQLTPHETIRTQDGEITTTQASGESLAGVVWDYTYQDNRHYVGYHLSFTGTITLTNTGDQDMYHRFRMSVPLYYTPYAPTEVELLCYEPSLHEIILYYDILVPAGQTVVQTIAADAWFSNPSGGADFNGDYIVDAEDMGLLYSAWGTDDPVYDLNGDGIVDGQDLGLLLEVWSDTNG